MFGSSYFRDKVKKPDMEIISRQSFHIIKSV